MCKFEDEIADASAKEEGFTKQKVLWNGESAAKDKGKGFGDGGCTGCNFGGGFFIWGYDKGGFSGSDGDWAC